MSGKCQGILNQLKCGNPVNVQQCHEQDKYLENRLRTLNNREISVILGKVGEMWKIIFGKFISYTVP